MIMAPVHASPIDEHAGIVATAEQIFAWAEHSKPGAEFIYATRCYLPIGSRGADAARTLSERGLAHLKQRKIPGSMQYNYVAERSSAPWSQILDRPRKGLSPGWAAKRDADEDAGAINALLPILQRHARFGRPCPTDAQLSERAGVDLQSVKVAMTAMVATGAIRIDGVKAPTLRIVTIVATGHRTGMVG